jgi:hypothetical protein
MEEDGMIFIKRIKMKKILLLFLVLLLLSFSAEKYYIFKMTEKQANYHWQNMEQIKSILDQSMLPHIQVKQIITAIDTLQRDLQIGLKIDSLSPTDDKR